MVHGCMVCTKRAEAAAGARGTSHVTTKQRRKNATFVAIQNELRKASHPFRVTVPPYLSSYFSSTLLTAVFAQPRILASSVFLGWAEGRWERHPFNRPVL